VKTWATLIVLLIVVAEASGADARQSAFRVSTFGAVGDGVHDDGAAIRKALGAAIQAGPGSRVLFEPKTYRLQEYAQGDYQLELADVKGIAIEGNGAR